MVSTVRTGPRFLVLGTNQTFELKEFFISNMKGRSLAFNEALEKGKEDNTIICITRPGLMYTRLDDIRETILIQDSSEEVFSTLINKKGIDYIKDSHVAPGNLIMRVVGNENKIIDKVAEHYQGKRMSLRECMDLGRSEQTIISFSKVPLNRNLGLRDLLPHNLLVNQRSSVVYRDLRAHALRYLTEGIENTDWYDVQIRIYDSFGAFDLHYERLLLVLDSLEMGMVLGEIWTRDYARILLAVVVYQIRLLTFLHPLEIKRILLGLEYLDNGGRVVDYDLYYNNKKISWPEVVKKPVKNKKEASRIYREDIMKRLSQDEKERMKELEEKILYSRK